MRGYSTAVLLSLALVIIGAANGRADPVEDFYRAQQVRFITAYSAGGLFDTATRIFARHIGKFISGKPNVWVDNMTGAGGLIATNYLANNAPRDGSVLLNLDGALLRLQALGNPAAKFDARQFNWLPSPGPDIQVCWVGKQSSWHNITEAFSSSKELKMGGLAPGTFPSDNARALQTALGINLKIVDGFKGVTEIRLATESGEVDGSCSSYEGVVRSFPKELKSGDIRVIAQIGEKPWPGLENVPNAIDLAKSEFLPACQRNGSRRCAKRSMRRLPIRSFKRTSRKPESCCDAYRSSGSKRSHCSGWTCRRRTKRSCKRFCASTDREA